MPPGEHEQFCIWIRNVLREPRPIERHATNVLKRDWRRKILDKHDIESIIVRLIYKMVTRQAKLLASVNPKCYTNWILDHITYDHTRHWKRCVYVIFRRGVRVDPILADLELHGAEIISDVMTWAEQRSVVMKMKVPDFGRFRKKKNLYVSADFIPEFFPLKSDPSASSDSAARRMRIWEAVNEHHSELMKSAQSDEERRQAIAFELHHLKDISLSDTAAILGVTVEQCKVDIEAHCKRMRERFPGMGDDLG